MEPTGLHRSDESRPAISRRRCGRGFAFYDKSGRLIASGRLKQRVLSLAILSAWRDVWICPDPNGHIQATGFDDNRRKQYIYHPDWVASRAESKFDHITQFASRLPRLRLKVEKDLGAKAGSAPQVLAATVRILDQTLLRIGNQRYAKENANYGLTTLRSRHVEVNGDGRIRFRFRGKGGKEIRTRLEDRRVAKVLRELEELPGGRVFQFQGKDKALHP